MLLLRYKQNIGAQLINIYVFSKNLISILDRINITI
jgi:hypothetical protein